MKQKVAFAFIMGIVTTGLVSFTIISINVGFTLNFLQIWFKSWLIGYFVAIPAILLIGPRVQWLVNRMF
ncbi:MAG: DUF2798 domain-containing protein [Bacteroidota bacterium]|nr:DUF2798 domain-containing protein [Bacteroidota bacterium]